MNIGWFKYQKEFSKRQIRSLFSWHLADGKVSLWKGVFCNFVCVEFECDVLIKSRFSLECAPPRLLCISLNGF